MKSAIKLFALLGLAVSSTDVVSAEMTEVKGWLYDNLCIGNCEGTTGPTSCTPDGSNAFYTPSVHTGECLLFDFCVKSGHSIMSEFPGEDGRHTIVLKLLNEANTTAYDLVKSSGITTAFPLVTAVYDDETQVVSTDENGVPSVSHAILSIEMPAKDPWAESPEVYYSGDPTTQAVCLQPSDGSIDGNNMCFRSDVMVSEEEEGEEGTMLVIESNGCPDHENMVGGSNGTVEVAEEFPCDVFEFAPGCSEEKFTGCCGGGSCGGKCGVCDASPCSGKWCGACSDVCGAYCGTGCSSTECSSCSAKTCSNVCSGSGGCSAKTCGACSGECSAKTCGTYSCSAKTCGACSAGCSASNSSVTTRSLEVCSATCSATSDGCYAGCSSCSGGCSPKSCYAGCSSCSGGCASKPCSSCSGGCTAKACGACGATGCSKCDACSTCGCGGKCSNSAPVGKYTPFFQHYTMKIPKSPGAPGDKQVLKSDVVGMMFNGVILDSHKQTWAYDVCNGHSDENHQYHYHIPQVCYLKSMGVAFADSPNWWINDAGGEVRKFDEMAAQFPATGPASPVVGMALDGYPIYGLYDEQGVLQRSKAFGGSLDECNGKFDSQNNYGYYLSADPPFAPACLKGTKIGSFEYSTYEKACPKEGIQNTILLPSAELLQGDDPSAAHVRNPYLYVLVSLVAFVSAIFS